MAPSSTVHCERVPCQSSHGDWQLCPSLHISFNARIFTYRRSTAFRSIASGRCIIVKMSFLACLMKSTPPHDVLPAALLTVVSGCDTAGCVVCVLSCLVMDCGRERMSSDYFCDRHMDKAKRVSWKVKTRVLFVLCVTKHDTA